MSDALVAAVIEDVHRLRAAGTDLTRIEVKAAAGGLPASMWETVSAFANTDSGRIILGLDEASGFAAAPGFDPAATRDRVLAGLRDKVAPTPPATVEIVGFEDSRLLVIDIEELAPHRKPCFVVSRGKEQGSYRRAGDGDHRMSTYEVFLHSTNVQQPQDDVQPVDGASIEDLKDTLVQAMLTRLRGQQRVAVEGVDDTEALRRLNVLTRGDGPPRPTVAGILALGAYPQQFFPQWMVTVAVYPGPAKDSVVGDVRMLDQATVDGPIPTMVERTVAVLLRNLRGTVRSSGAGAVTTPEIPLDVLREAVTNALTHRDYSSFARGEQVRIEVFPDRLEVINPGGVWGGRSERELLDGVSRSRNEKLALLLQDVPLPTGGVVCENRGSGIPRMIGLMRQGGLALPAFRDRTTTLTCSLARHGLLEPATIEALQVVGADHLGQQHKAVLALVLRGQAVDDQVVRHQLGIDTLDARKLLTELMRGGWLEPPSRAKDGFRASERLRQPPLFAGERLATPAALSVADKAILGAFRPGDLLDVHTITERAGLSLSYTRSRLRGLVKWGLLEPTAATTSRLRRYRLPHGGDGSLR